MRLRPTEPSLRVYSSTGAPNAADLPTMGVVMGALSNGKGCEFLDGYDG